MKFLSTCAPRDARWGRSGSWNQPDQFTPWRKLIGLCFAVVFCQVSISTAVQVEVTQAEFITGWDLRVATEYPSGQTTPLYTNQANLLVSNDRLYDYHREWHLGFSETNNPGFQMYAEAQAGSDWGLNWLSVSVSTDEGSAVGGYARAGAVLDLSFSPLTDDLTTITLDGDGDFQFTYSEGFVSLLDLTENKGLWYYGWGFPSRGYNEMAFLAVPNRAEPFLTYGMAGVLPWNFADTTLQRLLTEPTSLLSDHEYRLVMYTSSGAADNEQGVLLRLSGLEVPEPASFTLFAFGSAALLLARQRHRQ